MHQSIQHSQLAPQIKISVMLKCYSSEKLIELNTLNEVVPTGTHFTAELTMATRIKCLALGHNILMPGLNRQPLYPETDILTT